jgi:7,8-dihydropterin-6-yl-methyl-4-(beta-D-ribofuranosyl)aminobenzene 5'-phosphate synthase
MASDGFGEVAGVAVTVLADNRADLLLPSTDTVVRFTKRPLLAEHGFAALIDLADRGLRILWDAGYSRVVVPENMKRLGIDPAAIDVIALSHGHPDHTAAMTEMIRAASGQPEPKGWEGEPTAREVEDWRRAKCVPLIAHPAAFRERWAKGDDGRLYGPHRAAQRVEWEGAGAEIVLSEGPYRLADGCWLTGAVPRRSFESAGRSSKRLYRDGDRFLQDRLEDDQSVVIHIAGVGLVIVTGCAHAGIVNTIEYARKISGVDRVHAVLGGFHLAPASDQEIEETIDAFQSLSPAVVVPTHCSGFKAACRFAARMPEQFVQGAVGTKYLFGSSAKGQL